MFLIPFAVTQLTNPHRQSYKFMHPRSQQTTLNIELISHVKGNKFLIPLPPLISHPTHYQCGLRIFLLSLDIDSSLGEDVDLPGPSKHQEESGAETSESEGLVVTPSPSRVASVMAVRESIMLTVFLLG